MNTKLVAALRGFVFALPLLLCIAGMGMAYKGAENEKLTTERTDLHPLVLTAFGSGQKWLGYLSVFVGIGWFGIAHSSGIHLPHSVPSTIIPTSLVGTDPSLSTLDKVDAETDVYGIALKAKVDEFVANRKAATQAARDAMKKATESVPNPTPVVDPAKVVTP